MRITGKGSVAKLAALVVFVSGMIGVEAAAHALTTPARTGSTRPYEVDVSAGEQWTETNIVVRQGAKLHFTATGQITYPAAGRSRTSGTFGPSGLSRGWADLIHAYAVKDAGHGALIGRIGSKDYAVPFLIGESGDHDVPVGGKLFLGINQSMEDASTAKGSFHVRIEVLDEGVAGTASAGGPAETRVAGIAPDLLNKIPRRVTDLNNNPGDMVNVLIVGNQEQVVQAFTSSGWVKVDKDVKNAVLSAFMQSIEKKDYLTVPMSTLFLFNRPQDYGFAHAEPVKVAMSRHHLRVWKSPYTVDGRPLWCVSATHDVGFERDQRNNGVTHKIDAAIDSEREYVNGTLSETGLVVQRDHVMPADPVTTAKTATGGEFHSDGRIVVLVLKNEQ
ncbi:MAG: hypothetical protein CXZ00_13405 [Acidobacteria bacterium]|nr:MAG: hypothetical protein CXZ00_13405 [Acidobacteriota bacterium]